MPQERICRITVFIHTNPKGFTLLDSLSLTKMRIPLRVRVLSNQLLTHCAKTEVTYVVFAYFLMKLNHLVKLLLEMLFQRVVRLCV